MAENAVIGALRVNLGIDTAPRPDLGAQWIAVDHPSGEIRRARRQLVQTVHVDCDVREPGPR